MLFVNWGDILMNRKKQANKGEKKAYSKAQCLINSMQIPQAAVFDTAHFEINGNTEVVIDGSKGILTYDENMIKVNTGKMITTFLGRGLTIKCLTPDSLVVQGFITSIEFVK